MHTPFRRTTRRLAAALTAVAAGLAVVAPTAGAQSSAPGSAELVVVPPAPTTPVEPPTVPGSELYVNINDIHRLTNVEREKAGAPPVKRNFALDAIAQTWSETMAAEDDMYHNPQIRALMGETFPGTWRSYGENVLRNWRGATGEDLVAQWMRSTGHRLNLLNPIHTDLGVGAAVAQSNKLYATQNFARLTG